MTSSSSSNTHPEYGPSMMDGSMLLANNAVSWVPSGFMGHGLGTSAPMRVKLFTFRYSATLGGFDDRPLTHFVRDKEVLSFREHFFTWSADFASRGDVAALRVARTMDTA